MARVGTNTKNEIVKRTVVKYFNSRNNEVRFTRGAGCYVYDEDNREYLDCVLGYGPVVIGHANETFNQAISESLKSGIHLPGFTGKHDEYIQSLIGYSGIKASVAPVFMKTSSESNTGAVRIATVKTNRKGVLRCGFTGWHDVQHACSPSWHLPPKHRLPVRNTDGLRGVSNDEPVYNWVSLELEDLARILAADGKNISCFMIDAFQYSFVEKTVMEEAIRLCRALDILIVLDETKTAGRVNTLGHMGAAEEQWDMLILGKAIGNGAPISVLLVKEEFRAHALKAQVGGTHSKELLSVACATATLDIMQRNNGYETLAQTGSQIARAFNQCAHHAGLADIVQLQAVFGGSVLDMRFGDKLYSDISMLRYLQALFLDHGILHLVGHPSFVSLAHAGMRWDRLEERFYISLASWKEKYRSILLT